MGEVFAATHELMQREAVIKILLPEMSANQTMVKRFFQEAQAAARVKHPGIVEIFDFGYADDERAYIVMEMLRGEDLKARLKRVNVLPTEQAVVLIRQLAGAIGAAHEQGIVHRDIKPDNIFIVPDPEVPGGERVKVLDFGLAKLAAGIGSSLITRTGTIFGTPAYMAPEQCKDSAAVDHRADLYSIGCIFYKCLCGQAPFGTGGVELLNAHRNQPVVPPRRLRPTIPAHIDEIIVQLLQKKPGERIQTCRELIERLDAAPPDTLLDAATLQGPWDPPTIPDKAWDETVRLTRAPGAQGQALGLKPGIVKTVRLDTPIPSMQMPAKAHGQGAGQPSGQAHGHDSGPKHEHIEPVRPARVAVQMHIAQSFDGNQMVMAQAPSAGLPLPGVAPFPQIANPPLANPAFQPQGWLAPTPPQPRPDAGGRRRHSSLMASVGELYRKPRERTPSKVTQWLWWGALGMLATGGFIISLVAGGDVSEADGTPSSAAALDGKIERPAANEPAAAADDHPAPAQPAMQWYESVITIEQAVERGRDEALRKQQSSQPQVEDQAKADDEERVLEPLRKAMEDDDRKEAFEIYKGIPEDSEYHATARSEYEARRSEWLKSVPGEARKLANGGSCDKLKTLIADTTEMLPEIQPDLGKQLKACAARAMQLARASYMKSDYDKAMRGCRQVLDIEPRNAEAVTVCALSACKLGNALLAKRYHARAAGPQQSFIVQTCRARGIDLRSTTKP